MKIRLLRNIIIACFAILACVLWYLQCVQGSTYTELSQKNRIRLIPLPGPRGNIYDRNMKLIVGNRLAFDCAVIPQEFKASETNIKELAGLLKIKPEEIIGRISSHAGAPFVPVELKKDIGKETAIAISERSIDFPGLIIQTYPLRYYPHGNICSHITGYLGKISEEEFNALRDYGYKTRDFVGRGGVELYYDDYLKGHEGGMQTEVDSRGRELRLLGIREPEKGKDVVLTIDLSLQLYVYSLLADYNGAIVVMKADTGEILALVSKPDFDPNIFVQPYRRSEVKRLLQRKDYPLINRGISGTYPPGSIFKIVTASAGIETKKISPFDKLRCKGYYSLGNRRFNCWLKRGHGEQTITEGIKNSCNVFFYQVGKKVGVDILADYGARFGFGKPTGIDLPFEASGLLPSRRWKQRQRKEAWYTGETLNYAIGQGYLLVTPLQILRMANAVGTDNYLVTPRVVQKIETVEIFEPQKRRLNISPQTTRLVKEGMRKAVEDERGTAIRARSEGLRIAGKTGTAQTSTRKTHAWFVGFSPIDRAEVSLVVFLEYGGKGGNKPCTIASAIFAKLKELGYL